MLEAQEMFRTSNKVTRPEKALILGFMAGSRGQYIISNFLNLLTINVYSFSLEILLAYEVPVVQWLMSCQTRCVKHFGAYM